MIRRRIGPANEDCLLHVCWCQKQVRISVEKGFLDSILLGTLKEYRTNSVIRMTIHSFRIRSWYLTIP